MGSRILHDKVLIENLDYVVCQICGGEYRCIRIDHIKKHGMTFKEYEERFPKAETHCKKTRDAISSKATGKKQSPEHIEKRVSKMRGIKLSVEHRRKMSEAQTGRKHTPEHIATRFTSEAIAKRAAKLRGRKQTPEHIAKIHTLEMAIKIGKAHRGRKLSYEHKKKISNALMGNKRTLGYKQTPEHTAKCHTPEIRAKRSATLSKHIMDGSINPHVRGKKSEYFSLKMNRNIYCQSTYEVKACSLLDNDPLVIKFYKHPCKIQYFLNGDSPHYYIPDFKVVYVGRGIGIIEVKPDYQINDLINIIKFEAAKSYCEKRNMNFEVWSEKELGIR